MNKKAVVSIPTLILVILTIILCVVIIGAIYLRSKPKIDFSTNLNLIEEMSVKKAQTNYYLRSGVSTSEISRLVQGFSIREQDYSISSEKPNSLLVNLKIKK